MPVLGHKDIKRVVLPSTKDLPEDQQGWVEIDQNIPADVAIAVEKHQNTQQRYLIAILARVITAWNYTDESGQTVPINDESVAKLPIRDIKYLELTVYKNVEDEGGLDTEEKKD